MCIYPIVKFSCCDRLYKPTEDLPIVKFCPRGHADTIRQPFPGCDVRQPHHCNDFFRLPIKCPEHKLKWLNEMDLNDECQQMDRELREAAVSERLRSRHRDKMGRAFEMVVKCAERMEAERLQAWKVKIFCTGAALELLGTAIVGSDAKPLDYSVLEKLRGRLIKHINAEALHIKEDALRRQSPEEELGGHSRQQSSPTWTPAPSPPRFPRAAEYCTRDLRDGPTGANATTALLQQGPSIFLPEPQPPTQRLLLNQPIPWFRTFPPSQLSFPPSPAQMFPTTPLGNWPHFVHPRQPPNHALFLQESGISPPLLMPPFTLPTPPRQPGAHRLGAADQFPVQGPVAFSPLVREYPSAGTVAGGGIVLGDEEVSGADVPTSNGVLSVEQKPDSREH